MKFTFGPDAETELTEAQVIEQCKMYIAALHIAKSDFSCDMINIHYQRLKDLAPASDLVEAFSTTSISSGDARRTRTLRGPGGCRIQ